MHSALPHPFTKELFEKRKHMKTQLLATFGWGDFLSILNTPWALLILVVLGLTALILIAFNIPRVIDNLKDQDILFSAATNGDIKFVLRGGQGGNIEKVLINYKDEDGRAYFDETSGEIKHDKNKKLGFWERTIGVYFMPWYFILNERIHEYTFHWMKMCDEGKEPEGSRPIAQNILDGKVLVSRSEPVRVMRYVWVYPIHAKDVEVQGNFKISILANVTVRIVKPLEIISLLKGDWYSILHDQIVGRIADYVRERDIDAFRKDDKTGPGSEFVDKIKKHTYLDGRVEIIDVAYVGFDYSNNPPDVIAALMEREKTQKLYDAQLEGVKRAKELEGHKAEAAKVVREVNLLDAKARADGEAYAAEKKLHALHGHPDGSEIERARLLAEAIGKHTGSLVLGSNMLPTFDMGANNTPKIITNPREGVRT